jgi:predicted permease
VVATAVSLIWVALFGKGSMPHLLDAPLRQLGGAAFPLAMLTLGAYLCRHRAHDLSGLPRLAACMAVKLIIFPALVLGALMFFPFGEDLRFFLFLESVMPVAVSLVVIGSYTGADNKFFSGVIFYSHVAAIFTIPLWLAVYNAVLK